MTLKRLPVAAFVALILAFGYGGARADTDRQDIQAMDKVKLSLVQAIQTAEKQSQGRAIEAEFEAKTAGGEYEITVLNQDKLTKYKLDANSGQIRETGNKPVAAYFTRLTPQDVQGAQTTLAQAIATAEQHVGGKALDAEIKHKPDRVEYEVAVAKAGQATQKVRVSGTNGQVTLVEDD